MVDIDCDDSSFGRSVVGSKIEERSIVSNKLIVAFKTGKQLCNIGPTHRRIHVVPAVLSRTKRIAAEFGIENLVSFLGASPNCNDQVFVVVANRSGKAPLLFQRTMVDQRVRFLQCPNLVVVKFLEVIDARKFTLRARLVITTIVETCVIASLGNGTEFNPLDFVF